MSDPNLELLQKMRCHGWRIRLKPGDGMGVTGPAGYRLSDIDCDILRALKPRLVEALKAETAHFRTAPLPKR